MYKKTYFISLWLLDNVPFSSTGGSLVTLNLFSMFENLKMKYMKASKKYLTKIFVIFKKGKLLLVITHQWTINRKGQSEQLKYNLLNFVADLIIILKKKFK